MTEQTNRRASLTRAGVRVLAGAAGLAASVVVVTAVTTLPLPSSQAHAVSRSVTPVPATATVACPGPLLQLGSASSTSSLTALDTPAVSAGGDTRSPKSVRLKQSHVTSNGAEPAAFEDPADDGSHQPILTAGQSDSVNSADVRGLAAANCAQPEFDQWLVGGATALGETTLVVLGNPGAVTATVSIQAYSEQGLSASAGGSGIVVGPHSQRVVALAGLVPNASATVVRVTSTGGAVSAQLQEASVSGVTPQGVEWIGPTAAPAAKLQIPGAMFDKTGMTATATDSGDGGVPVLRVLPVGAKDAKLTIGVKPEGGKGKGTALTATASHGVVSEIPLDKLDAGTYDISIDSTQPLVAAAHTSTVDAKHGADFAWYASASPLTGPAAIPVVDGPTAALHLVNTTSSPVKITLDGTGGGTFTLPAGGSTAHRVVSGNVLTTSNAHGVVASVSYSSAGNIAAYVAYPTSASAAALTVYKR